MASRVFRWLLRLFPADFRGDFGAEMQESFDAERQDAASTRGRARVWAANVTAFLRLGPRLHAQQTFQDARYAMRTFRRAPVSTLLAVLALGQAIGSTTVTFSIADAFFFKPLPFADPDRLVHIWGTDSKRGRTGLRVSLQEFEAYAARRDLFTGVAAFNYTSEEVTGGAEPERIPSGRVSANALDVLGVRPTAGRPFQPGEDQPGAAPVVMVSHRYWQTRFGGRSDVLAQVVEISGVPHRVIGVMPGDFAFPLPTTDLWVPRAFDRTRFPPDVQPLQVVARLAAGVSMAQAAERLEATSRTLAAEWPVLDGRAAHVVPLRQALNFAYDIFSIGAVVVSLANLLVLLTAAANVSSLMLSRAARRGREVAVRAALGASRFRIVRQFLVESLLVGLGGGAAGVLMAVWALGLVNRVIPADLFRIGAFVMDVRALGVATALSIVAALLFGLAPALRFARVNLAGAMREDGSTGSASRSRLRLQQGLVVKQVALSLVLLVAMTLVSRSAGALAAVDPGFRAPGVLSVQTTLSRARYGNRQEVAAFQEAVLARAAAVPGVAAAAFVDYLPLNHEASDRQFERPGSAAPDRPPSAWQLVVSADYFAVLGIPLRAGRAFLADDREGRPPVVIINETMAARHWGQESPIGTRVRLEGETESRTVVGVVADSRQVDLARAAGDQLFVPQAQTPGHYLRLLVRTAGDPSDLIGPVTDAVHAVDPRLPLTEIRPLLEVVDEFLLPQRALRITLLVLGGVALALALFGVYGIVTCFVSERARELGIRVALGADAHRIVRFVVGRGFRLALRGVAIGIPLAALAGFALRGLLFGVSPFDPAMWVTVTLLVMGVATAAAWLPARRAARADPLRAIRAD